MSNFFNNKTSVFIATFAPYENGIRLPTNGMIEPMLSFLLPKTKRLVLIDGFHPGSSNVITKVYIYKREKNVKTYTSLVSILLYPLLASQNQNATHIIFKLRDFLVPFEHVVRSRKRYDLFIGLESVYTLCGILLKKIGVVKQVVYYVSDYSPNRFPKKWFNDVYQWLDRYCATNADYIWDVSPAMQPARIQSGLDSNKSKKVIVVPNALFEKQINPAKDAQIIPYSIVYAGTLTKGNGPDIAIEAIKTIIRKFPKTTLHIFGSNGDDQKRIKALIIKLGLEKCIFFHGFVTDAVDLTRDINCYSIGLAPYIDSAGSHRKYGDATKLRLYMGAGLPIITTPVPPLGKYVEKIGAGIVVKDNPKDIARACIKLFVNNKLRRSMRRKAIEHAKHNTWENTYRLAFESLSNR